MRWEMCELRGWTHAGPRTDVIGPEQIVGPYDIQQDPTDPSVY